MDMSPLQKKRLSYHPLLPELLKDVNGISWAPGSEGKSVEENIQRLFPKTQGQKMQELVKKPGRRGALRIGVVFSGGQAAGGHNVIAGILDLIF